MSTIRVGDNESVESALRRFKRKCSRDGIIGDLRKKEFYESPSVKKRKKAEAEKRKFPFLKKKTKQKEIKQEDIKEEATDEAEKDL